MSMVTDFWNKISGVISGATSNIAWAGVQSAAHDAMLLLPVIATASGIFLVAAGIVKATSTGSPQSRVGWGAVLPMIFAGATLSVLGSFMGMMDRTIFKGMEGSTAESSLNYFTESSGNSTEMAAIAAMSLMILLGWFAVMRGLYVWSSTGNPSQGKSPFWQGLWFIIGGAMAANMPMTILAVSKTIFIQS